MKASTLATAMGNSVSRERYAALLPALENALIQAGCTTTVRAAMFLAQLGHESAGLRYMEEIASGSAYEGRRDLGNVYAGDGRRFKGRGPIQITGRHNYTLLSKWAHSKGYVPTKTYFVDHPTQLAGDRYGFLGAVWYWTVARNMNSYADRKDILGATRAINGGTNGYADRLARWTRCLGLGTAILPAFKAVSGIVQDAVKDSISSIVKVGDAVVDLSQVQKGAKVRWRNLQSPGTYPGGACECITRIIPVAEAILIKKGVIKECLDFWQGSYSGAADSAGTHYGGGALDIKQIDDTTVSVLRQCGMMAYYRGPGARYGNFSTKHIHVEVIGCPHLSPGAARQVQQYKAGRNALANGAPDYHPRPSKILTWKQAYDKFTTEEKNDPVIKPSKFLRNKDLVLKKSKYYQTVPITDTGKTYAMTKGPGTVQAEVNIVTDRDCWARFITVNKKGSKEKIATAYPRVRIKAGGDQITLWDTIAGPAKGYDQKIVRLQVLAYSHPIRVKQITTRAGKG